MDGLLNSLVDAEDLPKIIFGLIFFIIWAMSALVSWLNKQQQQAKRQRVRDELERASRYTQAQPPRQPPPLRQPPPWQPPAPPRQQQPPPVRRQAPPRIAEGIAQRFPDVMLPPAPPPVPRPQQQRHPTPPRSQPPVQPSVRRPPRQPPQRRQALPPPPLPTLPTLEEVAPPAPFVNITQPAPRAKPPTVDATRVRHWLTPATLRQQFILTEILQPPLAVRPDAYDRS